MGLQPGDWVKRKPRTMALLGDGRMRNWILISRDQQGNRFSPSVDDGKQRSPSGSLTGLGVSTGSVSICNFKMRDSSIKLSFAAESTRDSIRLVEFLSLLIVAFGKT